ncbi:21987_t:CDS:2, partial [Gigaspora rosea]
MSEKYKLKYLNKLGEDLDDNFKDWKTLYNNILNFFEIPFEPELQQSSVQFLKSDLVIDLCEIFKNHIKTRIIRIFSDVIQLSNDLEISTLEGDCIILIVARRVEIKPRCLNVCMKSTNIIKLFKVNSQDIGGSLSLHKGEFSNIKIFDTKILQKEPFNKILQFSLQIACALFYDEPKVAQSIFIWIDKITKHSQSKEAKDQRSFVPLLDKKQFYERIREFMMTAEAYEKSYTKVLNNKNTNKMEIERLELLLSNCNNLTKSHEVFEKEENG